jgi:hypothetical protein
VNEKVLDADKQPADPERHDSRASILRGSRKLAPACAWDIGVENARRNPAIPRCGFLARSPRGTGWKRPRVTWTTTVPRALHRPRWLSAARVFDSRCELAGPRSGFRGRGGDDEPGGSRAIGFLGCQGSDPGLRRGVGGGRPPGIIPRAPEITLCGTTPYASTSR